MRGFGLLVCEICCAEAVKEATAKKSVAKNDIFFKRFIWLTIIESYLVAAGSVWVEFEVIESVVTFEVSVVIVWLSSKLPGAEAAELLSLSLPLHAMHIAMTHRIAIAFLKCI